MASRKHPAPTSPLPDELVWLAAWLIGELGLLIAHDGKRLSEPGSAHYASEVADHALTEFSRRFRK
jgi:hypothetical protein